MLAPIVQANPDEPRSYGLPKMGTIESWSCHRPGISNVSSNWVPI